MDIKLGGRPRQRTAGPAASDSITVHRDVVYGKTHPGIQTLDAYLVKSDRPTPVVVEFHGGGWRRGSKSQFICNLGAPRSGSRDGEDTRPLDG